MIFTGLWFMISNLGNGCGYYIHIFGKKKKYGYKYYFTLFLYLFGEVKSDKPYFYLSFIIYTIIVNSSVS